MQIKNINNLKHIRVLLVLQLVSLQKGSLTLVDTFIKELSCLTISNSPKPWVDCRNYFKTVGQWMCLNIH